MGGGGDDGSDEIRKQEEDRQERIRQSTERINRIFDQFDGVEYQAVNPVAGMSEAEYNAAVERALAGNVDSYEEAYQVTRPKLHRNHPNQAMETVTKYRTKERLNSAGQRALAQLGLTDEQIARAGTSLDGYQNFYGQAVNNPGSYRKVDTGDSFYDQYRQDFLEYQRPQLKDRFEDAQEDVRFDLARRGVTESSSGQQKLADLLEEYNKQQTMLESQATSAMNKYRSGVEQQRQSLISQAQAGMAPTDAANLASNAFSSLKAQQPEYSALGDVFGQFADVYGMNLRAQGAGFEGMDLPGARSTRLPSPGGTGKVRN